MSIADVATRCAAAALVLVALAACAAPGEEYPRTPEPASQKMLPEPPTTEFDPGYIVSDDAFYDSSAMSEDEIQAFLESVSCRPDEGVRCLADFTQSTTSALAERSEPVATWCRCLLERNRSTSAVVR